MNTQELTRPPESDLRWLIETYFNKPERRFQLKKGEILLRQNEYNDRLYLVREGKLKGYLKNPDGIEVVAFESTRDMFVGVHSFFSRTFTSLTTVVAEEDTVLEYIDHNQEVIDDGRGRSLVEQFMPVMIKELVHRQHHIQNIAIEKERALKALIHSEKMVSLGRISAGIAHELNNAISVLERNCEWLCDHLEVLLKEKHPELLPFYTKGIEKGRFLSSRDVRKQAKELQHKYSLSEELARKTAPLGLTEEELGLMLPKLQEEMNRIAYYWEIGATLNDMKIAADHATHVVKSVKALGARQSERKPDVDINESIHEAITLLSSPLRKITVEQNLSPLPPITANKGELVQIFVNIINNAYESMTSAKTENPTITITTACDNNHIVVGIQDNGPGIPSELLPKIFEPTLTTKKDGLSIGLGLGLTIVERLVDSYGGVINVESEPGRTLFSIHFPVGGENAKTHYH